MSHFYDMPEKGWLHPPVSQPRVNQPGDKKANQKTHEAGKGAYLLDLAFVRASLSSSSEHLCSGWLAQHFGR